MLIETELKREDNIDNPRGSHSKRFALQVVLSDQVRVEKQRRGERHQEDD